jgi:hypothetical protein
MKPLVDFNLTTAQFVKLDGPIESKWQANFLQVFPPNYEKLPAEHETDEAFFDRHYKGEEKLTFEEFKRKYYGKKDD